MSPTRVPSLTVFAPGRGSTDVPLSRSPFLVGRDRDNDLCLEYPWMSRRHMVLELIDGSWTVRIEGRNELRLNGSVLVDRAALAPGDRIDAGPLTLFFDAARARPLDLDDRAPSAVTLSLPVADVLSRGSAPDRYLVLLGETSQNLAGLDDDDEVARRAARVLLDAVGARSASVVEIEAGSPAKARISGLQGAPIESVRRALLERSRKERATLTLVEEGAPVMLAPLGAPLAGVLYAIRENGGGSFAESEALFATVLAQLTGAAIDVARREAATIEEKDRISEEREELRRDIERRGRFGSLIGRSAVMQRLATSIAKVAPTDATVLIGGETGAGKELVAREIHNRSSRASGPFFALNCAALPENLIESELFGHRRGAFTGADRDRRGVFELARGGTVFLDEIGELPAAAQAKVLRVLDSREILPLGGGRPVEVDVRLLAATHRDLSKEVAAGRFRQDLYFRLNVFPIAIPPLRDRAEDIPALAEFFLSKSAEGRRKKITSITPRALEAISSHDFPGNVRELAHLIERAVILADEGELLDLSHLPDELSPPSSGVLPASMPMSAGTICAPEEVSSLRDVMAALERAVIVRELEKDGWNRTKTAQRLDCSLRAFMEKLRKYQIKGPMPSRGKDED